MLWGAGSTGGCGGTLGGCGGALGGLQGTQVWVAGFPYRVQYHSFRQREHRLAASVPHTLQRGLSGARASIISRL